MEINKAVIEQTRKYLNGLNDALNNIEILEIEIEELEKLETYQELDFEKIIGFKSKSSYKDIGDTSIYIRDKITMKQAEIDHIRYKYRQIEALLNKAKENEKEIMLYRYFRRNRENNRYTVAEIAQKTRYSVSSIKRIENKMIKNIAIFKFKDRINELEVS